MWEEKLLLKYGRVFYLNILIMSRIGKKPISLPSGVTVSSAGATVSVSGPKGELTRHHDSKIEVRVQDGQIIIVPQKSSLGYSAVWGLWRSLVANMVEGVSSGFEKKLEIEGIGYRAAMEGNVLVMQLGFSHPVRFLLPEGIMARVEKSVIVISGADKELVGIVAARIRSFKKPEPYKGKGIHYQGEVIRRKAGKKAVASA